MGSKDLRAGELYDIQLSYYDNRGKKERGGGRGEGRGEAKSGKRRLITDRWGLGSVGVEPRDL